MTDSKFLAWCRNPNKRKRQASSLHGQIYAWACMLRDDGIGHARAYHIIRRMVDAVREDNGGRFTPDREILSAIQYAYEVTPATGTARVRPWPVPNKTLQAECRRLSKRREWSLEKLREASALEVHCDGTTGHKQTKPEWFLAALLGTGGDCFGDPLVCVGMGVSKFETAPLSTFSGQLHLWEFVVPNAMSALEGKRKSDGELSAHTLDNTGPRQNIVVEFDDGATLDEQAARHIWLSEFRDLRMVVFSGSKSLHGWYRATDEASDRKFMEEAVRLGGDPKTWLKSQFVRMPNGQRENGTIQRVEFFDA
jgi:hypothetical protein